MVVLRGDGCREGGKSKSPLPGWLFRPFLATQKGARRRHDKKTDTKKGSQWVKGGFMPRNQRTGPDVGMRPRYGAGRAAIKAAPTEPRMHRPIGAREAALGRQPLRKMPGIEKRTPELSAVLFFSYFFKRSSNCLIQKPRFWNTSLFWRAHSMAQPICCQEKI